MTYRALHAVQFAAAARDRMLGVLAAALDGSGPPILPLDPALSRAALARVLAEFRPAAVHTEAGTELLHSPAAGRGAAGPGIADDTAVVIATSGSTGRPKAVELSAAALTASATASLRRIGASPELAWLCCLPTFHISGLGVLVRSLVTGTAPVFAAAASPQVLAVSDCAYVSLVPTQLRRLLDAGAGPGPVQAVLIGGAAPGEALLADARAAGWRVITTYGMSETCGGCVYDSVPLDGVQVRLADGRVEIAGPTLFTGYLGRPELTASVLTGGWFLTADLGYWLPGGGLAIRGRADDVINTGGKKVVPGDVEAVLGTAPGVADVVVVGLPDPEWGEMVTAIVIPANPADPPGLTELRSNVRAVMSAYAAPRRVVVVSQFPLLPSGKPDRVAVRELAQRQLAAPLPGTG
ncbi:MAG: AMP-binding protein [Streptosporangiaceae bacterium]